MRCQQADTDAERDTATAGTRTKAAGTGRWGKGVTAVTAPGRTCRPRLISLLKLSRLTAEPSPPAR